MANKMWYAFTMDEFVYEAPTKKELLSILPIGALPYKVRRYGAGRYEVLIQDESEKSFWAVTYYIYDSLLKADEDGFKTLYDYYLMSKAEYEKLKYEETGNLAIIGELERVKELAFNECWFSTDENKFVINMNDLGKIINSRIRVLKGE